MSKSTLFLFFTTSTAALATDVFRTGAAVASKFLREQTDVPPVRTKRNEDVWQRFLKAPDSDDAVDSAGHVEDGHGTNVSDDPPQPLTQRLAGTSKLRPDTAMPQAAAIEPSPMESVSVSSDGVPPLSELVYPEVDAFPDGQLSLRRIRTSELGSLPKSKGGYMIVSLTIDGTRHESAARFNDFKILRNEFRKIEELANVDEGFPGGKYLHFNKSFQEYRTAQLQTWLERILKHGSPQILEKLRSTFKTWFLNLQEKINNQ